MVGLLGVTFDCFAHHMQDTLDISNVAFVKLDVEGFEIAVLKGAQNSLFKHLEESENSQLHPPSTCMID